jgi:restriction endonuclease S subunit
MSPEEKKPYLIKQGDILFNRTNSKELVGKCCVFDIPGEFVFASYLIRVRLNQDALLPDYVAAYLASPLGRLQIDAVSRQIAGMTNINAEEIRELRIPVPSKVVQEKVVDSWRNAISRRDETLKSVRRVLGNIDSMLLMELGVEIKSEPPNNIKSRIFSRALSDVSGGRLDPIANQEKRRLFVDAICSGYFPVQPLRQVVNFEKKLVNSISPGDIYIGLENIDGESGEYVASVDKESVGTAVKFEQGQILFPKLRPYLNKTHLATFSGLCSTEFHVFTPLGIRGDYLTVFLRSRAIVGITSLLMTGNTLPRLQLADIVRLPIPIPPPQVQEKLCSEITKLRLEAASLRATAAIELNNAKKSIEALILGYGSDI